MRMWMLGRTECHSQKQMQKPSDQILLKCLKQPSQSPYIYHNKTLMDQWKLSSNQAPQPFDLQKFQKLSQPLQHPQSSSLLQPPPQLSQDKLKEVRALINYLPTPHHLEPPHLRSALHFAFDFSLKAFNSSQYLRQKLEQHLKCENWNLKREEYIRISRNKLALCYSYKWRQLQSMVYLLVHTYGISQKEASKVRIHIINKRGLILQTISNLEYSTYSYDIILTIRKHYSKIDTVVIIHPQSSLIPLDHFKTFVNQLGKYTVIMLTLHNRQSLKQFSGDCTGNTYLNHLVPNTYIYIDTSGDIVICHNGPNKAALSSYAGASRDIVQRENTLAEYFECKHYFSPAFNQKQMLLRLFAFYFNFLTLDPMLPEGKDNLIDNALDYQLECLNIIESEHQNSLQNAKTHAFTTSTQCLYCLVCKKRTKITCQKCRLTFSYTLGLCQKGCFEAFHTDMQKYIPQNKHNKTELNPILSNSNSQDEQLLQEQSIRGRKRVKQQQSLSESQQESNLYQNLEELKEKWNDQIQSLPQEYNTLIRFASVGAISGRIIKKIDYLLEKTNPKPQSFPSAEFKVKKEEDQS